MVLHIDPRFPLVWRTPSSLQFGVDQPPVVIHNVTNAQERVIAALIAGVTPSGLQLVLSGAGGSAHDLSTMLRVLQPILMSASVPKSAARTVAIYGTGSTVSRLRAALTHARLGIVAPSEPADIGVLVTHYVTEPELFGVWLRRDVPHLPIVFGDTGVRIGPMIEPGTGPCLYCLERHRTDADASWPAIASQLWGRRSTVEDAVVSGEVVAIATRLVAARLGGSVAMAATSIHLDATTGKTRRREWKQHPECGCAALPRTDSAAGLPRAPDPQLPTTGEAAGVPV
ncbi:MAG: hypothetical protein JWP30_1597 [Homoserinimonas sp.]|jgi:bacteriocin biosynthesis cyclodehydratase domain-containing protein|nr:hypothetical protein [Homoserinimonas sp.]